ncbi:hypothetical protein EEB13_30515 [Rhodococcus sp. WS3]|nr:hypothetical protein EEB13_30515 [Rhodococcus sp. WS3]RZL20977.1 MAG: hypothetical protein EOP31_30200 [Rhodococcus sp. (in: high G+C Gram-positive bacteria)]
MLTRFTARRASLWGRRAAAVLALCSAGLHTGSLIEHRSSPLLAGMMVLMIIGCVHCARHLWMSGRHQDWGLVSIVSLGMIAVHLAAMSSRTAGAGGHHKVADDTTMQLAVAHQASSPLMNSAVVIAATEAVLAFAVLIYRTRHDFEQLTAEDLNRMAHSDRRNSR